MKSKGSSAAAQSREIARTATRERSTSDPSQISPRETAPEQTFLRLQQAIGNRGFRDLLGEGLVQPKLRIGPPGDRFERQSEQAGPSFQANRGGPKGNVDPRAIQTQLGPGRPLASSVVSRMRSAFGRGFSGVRVHDDAGAAGLSSRLHARAFTVGNHIAFGSGEYRPGTLRGDALMAHELAHTVQQRNAGASSRATTADRAFEADANRAAAGAVASLWPRAARGATDVVGNAGPRLSSGLTLQRCGSRDKSAKKLDKETAKEATPAPSSNQKKAESPEELKGKPAAHGIDYDQLFKDKKLEIGVAVGAGFHSTEFLDIVKLLNSRGFKLTHDAPGNKKFTKKKKFKPRGKGAPVEIEIIVDVISEKAKDAKKTFGGFLSQKEITIYSGHARYGTGPDFDSKKSPAENFVIGVNSALHKAGKLKKGYNAKMNKILKKRKNDLEQMSKAGKFDPGKYQVWFFNACKTLHYLDEVRGGLVTDKAGKKKSNVNLRFFGTKKNIVSDAIPILKGILDMQTMDEIVAAMHKYETGKKPTGGKSDIFFAD